MLAHTMWNCKQHGQAPLSDPTSTHSKTPSGGGAAAVEREQRPAPPQQRMSATCSIQRQPGIPGRVVFGQCQPSTLVIERGASMYRVSKLLGRSSSGTAASVAYWVRRFSAAVYWMNHITAAHDHSRCKSLCLMHFRYRDNNKRARSPTAMLHGWLGCAYT